MVAFTGGKPFQNAFYSNSWFTLFAVLVFMVNVSMLIFYKSFPVDMQLSWEGVPGEWRVLLSVLCVLNSGVTLCYEKFIIARR